jgi:multiple sugar transport system ATP-binding protein
MATLELQGASKRFGAITAVEDISLRVENGEFFSIFGPPGCGKTTILRLLLGLVVPDEGRVLIDGRDVTYERPKQRDLGMVFQNLALFPHLTAWGNIAFPLVERGAPKTQIDTRVRDVAATLKITPLLKKHPAQLSGGERQRVAIARALVRNPQAYLMDEPIAALDARLRETTRVELKRLQRELKHTLVYVTHDQEEAMSIADRIAVMRDGRICQVGTPDEIYNAPRTLFVAQTVGSPRINSIEGRLVQGAFEAAAMPLRLTLPGVASEGAATAAIRPEDLAIEPADAGGGGLAAAIYEVEPLGGYTVVDVSVGETILRASVPGNASFALGQPVRLQIDASRCHLFDAATGDVLRHAA